MPWIKKNILEILTLLIITITGFYFRLSGIVSSPSFWSDEAYVASIAKDMAVGKIGFFSGLNIIPYQRLHLILVYESFKIFGVSEFAGRVPSVIFGSIGIIFAYLLAKKLSNKWGGILASLLIGFSQISLAQSTQAKPYISIFSLMLVSHYLMILLQENKSKKNVFVLHLLIILINSLATLFNYLGIIAWIPYSVYLILRTKNIFNKNKILAVSAFVLVASLVFFLRIPYIFLEPVSFKYNWFSFFNEFILRQYLVFSLPALIGLLFIKNTEYKISTVLQLGTLFIAWNFFKESHNIRYIFPLLGYIFILFSSFWANIGEIFHHRSGLVIMLVVLTVFVSGYKIVRKPAVYYTPNADFVSDVQNADYKEFFSQWRKRYPDFENYPIFAGPFDSLAWYTDRFPTTTFNRFTTKPTYFPKFGFYEYPDLENFKNEMNKYSAGFVMIHDWESYMSDEIKDYVKNNLKFELRVESMAVSPNDKWPLELYSWGFEKK